MTALDFARLRRVCGLPSEALVTPRGSVCLALVGMLAFAPSCRIFDLLPVPCSNDNDVQECSGSEVCVDGLCAPRPRPEAPCEVIAVEDAPTLRRLSVGTAKRRGPGAMEPRLLGALPDLELDLSCAPECDAFEGSVPGARAPLVEDSAAASLEGPPLEVSGSQRDTRIPFALELVLRSPTTPGATLVGASTSEEDGWRVETTAEGATVLRVGAAARVTLATDGAGVWTYALCLVDTTRLTVGDARGLLCSVDGGVRSPGVIVGEVRPSTAPMVLGQEGGNDGVLALVRTWPLASGWDLTDAAQTLALLAEQGRSRLFQYLGVTVETDGEVRVGNPSSRPRVVELPASTSHPRAVAWVGAAWPRLIEIKPTLGVERTPTAGLQFEPRVENLLGDVGRSCTARAVGPTGRRDACAVAGGAPQTGLTFGAVVERNTPFVFSFFFPESTSDLQLVFEQTESSRAATCIVSAATGTTCADEFSAAQVESFGTWRRFTWATSLGFPLGNVRFESLDAVVWAPQLELGSVATSPIGFLDSAGRASTTRDADLLVIDRARLGVTEELSLSAKLLDLKGRAAPVTLLDDDDEDDGVLRLYAESGVAADGVAPRTSVSVEGRIDQRVISTAVLEESASTVVAGHVGTSESPLEPCVSCVQTPVVTGEPMQVETVRIAGPHAVFEEVSVVSFGRQAVPTALELQIDPTGAVACVDDDTLFTFRGCAAGVCPEIEQSTLWDSPSGRAAPSAGAFPGDIGHAGRRTTDLFDSDTFGTLLLEARFQTPADGNGGNVVAVRGGTRAGVRLDLRVDARYDVVVLSGDDGEVVADVGPSEWNQLVCLLDEPVRCLLNLGTPAAAEALGGPNLDNLVAAELGDKDTALRVSFARASVVRGSSDRDGAERLLRRRAAALFGLQLASRRSEALVREGRLAASYVSVPDAAGALQLVRVGSAWPRVEDLGTGAAYAVGPGGANVLAALLPTISDDDAGPGQGPHPDIPSHLASPGQDVVGPFSTDGVVSLFVAGPDATSPGTGRAGAAQGTVAETAMRLRTDDALVDLGGARDGAPGGVVRYAGWSRIWLRVRAGVAVVIEREAALRWAALQFEPRAVSPGAPAMNGVLSGDTLEVEGTDFAGAGSAVAVLDVERADLGGRFFSIMRSTAARLDLVALELNNDTVEMVIARRNGITVTPNTVVASFPGRAGLDRLTAWWGGGRLLLGRSDGTAHVAAAPFVESYPTLVVVGGGQVRLRSLGLQRGDLRAEGPSP